MRPSYRNTPDRRQLLLLLAVSVPFIFAKLGMPLLDPDEGLYASIAREMLERGDWVIPHINGVPYLEKPPLYFWLTAFTFALFGYSEWAVRLWSALSTLGAVLLTWRIGLHLYGRRAGLLAGWCSPPSWAMASTSARRRRISSSCSASPSP